MDLPRGLLDGRFNQRGEPARETDGCAARWVPDLRARPPAELLDNLRWRLSQLADNHPSAERGRPSPRDWDPPRQCDAPAGSDAPDDWLELGDWDALAAERGIETPADQPADAGDAQERGFGGIADAIRAASRLSDAFSDSPHVGSLGDMSFFAQPGQTQPYRPWFMSGDPSTPWWAEDSGG